MTTVFIADGHLKGPGDPNQRTLVDFLDELRRVDNLVILGDLFDFWTGFNEVVHRNYLPVLESLLRLKRRGAKIIYFEGNHDFSMGSFFTNELKAEVYTGPHEETLDGKRFFLLHGDTVSMTPGYRLWRSFLRSPLFRLIAHLATPAVVWRTALWLSMRSRSGISYKSGNETDKRLRGFARDKLRDSGIDCVVFAHSHASGIFNEEGGVSANPGSWAADKSYLVFEKDKFRLERFKVK